MSTQNEKHNYDFQKRMINRKKFIITTPVLVEELRHRLELTDLYNSKRELDIFVSYAKKFDDSEKVLTLLHNCHVIRINNGYPSKPKHIVQALKMVMKPDDSLMALEKAIGTLGANMECVLNREELGLDKFKKIDEIANKPKEKTDKNTSEKHNESENYEKYLENEPSDEDLKQLEKKLDNETYNEDTE